MKVLVGCEYSGTVRDAFARQGHDAWSCDILPTEKPGNHIQGDLIPVLYEQEWDLAILHPPCTRLANSGVRWLAERNLWADLDEAAAFFRKCLDAPVERIAVENPIQHRHARERIGVDYDQIIHPWQFGHGEQKATCLWLKNLPKLIPTNVVEGREQRVWKMGPSPDRAKERARFFTGWADAMAHQWGNLPLTQAA